jgi:hypothetical protein
MFSESLLERNKMRDSWVSYIKSVNINKLKDNFYKVLFNTTLFLAGEVVVWGDTFWHMYDIFMSIFSYNYCVIYLA